MSELTTKDIFGQEVQVNDFVSFMPQSSERTSHGIRFGRVAKVLHSGNIRVALKQSHMKDNNRWGKCVDVGATYFEYDYDLEEIKSTMTLKTKFIKILPTMDMLKKFRSS